MKKSIFSRIASTRPRRLPVPSFWVAFVLHLALAFLLASLPLFNLLGYEFCAAVSLLASITCGPVAIGIAQRRDALLPSSSNPTSIVLRSYLRGVIANLATLAGPLLVIWLNALKVKNCNLPMGFLFFLLLPVCTAVLVSSWGTVIGFVTKRRMLGGLLFAMCWLLSAGYNLYEVWGGPQMDSYNQLIGWVAGPIYDEAIKPGLSLLYSRIHGGLWALFLLAFAAAALDTSLNHLRLGAIWSNRNRLLWTGLTASAAVCFFASGTSLGFRRSEAAVQSVLSSTTNTAHFVIHHAPELAPDKIKLLAQDHEFRFHQIEALLGAIDLKGPIHSYLFRDARQKRRLVGASRTEFSKPWIPAIYLNGQGFPHPSLKHELVHAYAGHFGSWPLRLSARGLFWVNAGLTEGLAVAVDWPSDPVDPHVWSAALRRIGKAPNIRDLMDPVGFWTSAARRSYTVAGSFVRFLLDRYGAQRLRQAFQSGNLEGQYPEAPEALYQSWESFLDDLPLDDALLEVTKQRFIKPSLFERVCAREVATLHEEAQRALIRGKLEQAFQTTQLILQHLPDDPETQIFQVEVLTQLKREDEALAQARRLIDRADLGPALKVPLEDRIGDLLWRLGEKESAQGHYLKIADTHLDEGTDRMALIKLEALQHGESGRLVLEFLRQRQIKPSALLQLHEAALMQPGWGTAWYLLGRQLYNQEDFERAMVYLEKAGLAGLAHSALAVENLRLLAIANYRTHRPTEAAALLMVLKNLPRDQNDLRWAADWSDRIVFDASH